MTARTVNVQCAWFVVQSHLMAIPGSAVAAIPDQVYALDLFLHTAVSARKKIVMMMYYWVHDVKAKHVMLFEDIANWDTIANYNNFFRIECHNWLINQQVELGGFDHNGHPK